VKDKTGTTRIEDDIEERGEMMRAMQIWALVRSRQMTLRMMDRGRLRAREGEKKRKKSESTQAREGIGNESGEI
jgi:hypothetical protein